MPACLRQRLRENVSLSVSVHFPNSRTLPGKLAQGSRVVIFVVPLKQSGRSDVHFACTLAEA